MTEPTPHTSNGSSTAFARRRPFSEPDLGGLVARVPMRISKSSICRAIMLAFALCTISCGIGYGPNYHHFINGELQRMAGGPQLGAC